MAHILLYLELAMPVVLGVLPSDSVFLKFTGIAVQDQTYQNKDCATTSVYSVSLCISPLDQNSGEKVECSQWGSLGPREE